MTSQNKDGIWLFWYGAGAAVVSACALQYFKIMNFGYVYLHVAMVFRQFLAPMIISLFQQNQFVQVVVFGSVSAYLCFLGNTFYRIFILPMFTGMQCSIVIHNMDPNFHAVMDFISDRLLQKISGAQYSLQANTKAKENKTRREWMQEWLRGDKSDPPELVYRPDNDQVIHTITYRGKKIFVERAKSNPLMGRDKPFTPESLKLTTWGSDNSVLKQLMTDAVNAACKQLREGTVSIYTLSSGWCSGWELALTKKARPKDSVILDMQDMDMLLDDARNFLQSGKWYVDMGIPYRRGYLLYGPPGCGKTSFAQVLAGELQLDICILNLTHAGLTDDAIAEYLRDAPVNSVIVLEDIDAIFVERTATKESDSKRGGNTSVSFSGLLNALDGVASQEGRLLFMTTNHIEKLDPALVRPGRCDVQLQLKLASKNQMERMFLRFYPGEAELAKVFAASLPPNELSMAALQGYFLKCSESAQACVDQTSELLQASRPTPEVVKSTYEHLRRVGLERYAAVLEFHGISTEQDLAASKLEDLTKLSVELQFDAEAQRLFKQLMDSDNKRFVADSYALAEVSHIRERFLAAYADVTDEALMKTVCTPLLRHHSHSSFDAAEVESSLAAGAADISEDASIDVGRTSESSSSSGLEQTDPSDLSEQRLRELSRAFCNALSCGGKGIISHHNLRRLLEAHPHRPAQCVKAAVAFTQPRSVASKVVKHLDLYTFLKRAGLANAIHKLINGEVDTLSALLQQKGSDSELCAQFQRQFKLDKESALRLAEVVTKTSSESGNLVNFGLHPRARVMSMFQLFYTAGAAAFPCYTDVAIREGTDEAATSETGTDAESAVAEGAEAVATAESVAPAPAPLTVSTTLTENQLEKLAYQFGLLTSDAQGTSVVSMLEVLDHLRRYSTSPAEAVSSALAELVNPPYPVAPAAVPAPAPVVEWVDEWLKTAPGSDITNYAQKFKDQGFVEKQDFLVGSVLTLDELEKMGVTVLAHRRRLVALHEKLIAEQGLQDKTGKCSAGAQ